MAPDINTAAPVADETDKIRATPRARVLAREAGIDLAGVPGSGPRGRVQGDDVAALLRSPQAASPAHSSSDTAPLSVTRSRGGSGTPVVFLHGFAADATAWAPLEACLQGTPCIRVELPGHGKSPKHAPDGFAALVAAVRRAFDELDLNDVHLVGHSLGGAVALALADTRPRMIAGLTLIAPAGLGPEISGETLAGICKASRPESLAPWLRTLVHDETIVTDAYARLAMTSRAAPGLRAAQTAIADALFPDGVQAFDLRAALDRLTVPTTLIWGRSDRIIPWRHALRAPGRVALHLFDNVGHMPHIEIPQEVGKILAARL